MVPQSSKWNSGCINISYEAIVIFHSSVKWKINFQNCNILKRMVSLCKNVTEIAHKNMSNHLGHAWGNFGDIRLHNLCGTSSQQQHLLRGFLITCLITRPSIFSSSCRILSDEVCSASRYGQTTPLLELLIESENFFLWKECNLHSLLYIFRCM